MRVLLVEDEPNCVRFIKAAIQDLCDDPIQATGFLQEALKLAHGHLDAVWLDLNLLDARAPAVIAAIPLFRSLCPKATLIVVSGLDAGWREAAMAAGADAYGIKQDLQGFNPMAVCALLSEAAVHAMGRGVPAGTILERVTSFLSKVASRR